MSNSHEGARIHMKGQANLGGPGRGQGGQSVRSSKECHRSTENSVTDVS